MRVIALALLLACGSDKAASPPPPSPSPTVAADAGIDAPDTTREDVLRDLKRLQKESHGSPPFVPLKPRRPTPQECHDDPLLKGC